MGSVDQEAGRSGRLGGVAWDEAGPASRYAGQGYFLSVLTDRKPAIVSTLSEALPNVQRIPEAIWDHIRRGPSSKQWESLRVFASYEGERVPALTELVDWLDAWGVRWRLVDPWIMNRALAYLLAGETLGEYVWRATRSYGSPMTYGPNGWWELQAQHPDGDPTATPIMAPTLTPDGSRDHVFAVRLTPWRVTESRTEWTKRVTAEFKELVAAYADDREEQFVENGFQPARKKLALDHFDWLARLQLGESRNDIVASLPVEEGVDAETLRRRVGTGIDYTAQHIGLYLHSGGRRGGGR